MPSRPDILFLSHCLPYPPQMGVAIRTYNILRQLQQGFDVRSVMFSRTNHQPDGAAREASRRALESLGIRVAAAVPIAAEHSTVRRAWDHARSITTGRAYTHYEYASRDFRHHLDALLSESRPALIHLDSLDLHGWIDGLPAVPVVCTHHDIESDALRQRATSVRSRALAAYIRLQAERVERVERTMCPQFAANVVMSAVDANRLQTRAPGARTVVIPNGVDTDDFTPQPRQRMVADRVVFVGGTHFFPNRDAVTHFLADIWPRIRARRPAASLHLIGRVSAPDRARFEREPGVRSLGHVDDIREHVAEASCTVVPIRIGGGTRIKILDAWAMGRPVVSTSRGCEGLEAADGENILIRDAPLEFAEAVVRVLEDSDLQSCLAASGRDTVERTYSWHIVGQKLRAEYAQLL